MVTIIHGALNSYNNGKCRCDLCRKANTDYQRERKRAYRRGVPNSCELCGVVSDLAWDHHHETVSHRGWLCRNCNTMIGKFKEAPEIMESAVRYLEAHR